jgi:N-methylhydantoinase A
MLTCDVTHIAEASELRGSPFDEEDVIALDRQFARVEEGVLERFRAEGQKPEDVSLARHVGMHYRQQVHMVDVPVAAGPVGGETLAEVQAEFERLYARIYGEGSVLRGGGVELARLRVTGTVAVDPVPLLSGRVGGSDPAAALKGRRQAYFDPAGFSDTPVYSGHQLAAGNRVAGPAIIERMGDSVVIPPCFGALVDASLTLKITSLDVGQPGSRLSAHQEVAL